MLVNVCRRHIDPPSTSLPVDVTQAFTDLLGDAQAPLKGALRTARLIEEQFLTDGWPIGRCYGGETELARRYDAGEAMIREAIRILEARGTARMRLGRNASLEVTAPSREQFCEGMVHYCSLLGVTRAQVAVARMLLDRAIARIAVAGLAVRDTSLDAGASHLEQDGQGWRRWLLAVADNSAITFYSSCLDDLNDLDVLKHDRDTASRLDCSPESLEQSASRLRNAVADRDSDAAADWAEICASQSSAQRAAEHRQPEPSVRRLAPQHTKRALQIVSDLQSSLRPGQWRDGVFLGNEQELSARYDVDRRSLRQAIRILEASQVAVTLPGRGHGLMACTPKPASFSRLICCHFAADGIARSQVFQAFEQLSIETLGFAAKHADPARLAEVAQEAKRARQNLEMIPRQQAALEEQHFALADNPLLELFLRSARAYNTLGGIGRAPPRPDDVSGLADCVDEVTEALLARDGAAAARAQARKCAIVKRSIGQPELPESRPNQDA